jgi:hypothetical protein
MDSKIDNQNRVEDDDLDDHRRFCFVFPVVHKSGEVRSIEIAQDESGLPSNDEKLQAFGLEEAGSAAFYATGINPGLRLWQVKELEGEEGENSAQFAAFMAAVAADCGKTNSPHLHTGRIWASGALEVSRATTLVCSIPQQRNAVEEIFAKIKAFRDDRCAQVFFLPMEWARVKEKIHGLQVLTLSGYLDLADKDGAWWRDRHYLVGIQSPEVAYAVRALLGLGGVARPVERPAKLAARLANFREVPIRIKLALAFAALFGMICIISGLCLLHGNYCDHVLKELRDNPPVTVEHVALEFPSRVGVSEEYAHACYMQALNEAIAARESRDALPLVLFGSAGMASTSRNGSAYPEHQVAHAIVAVGSYYADAAYTMASYHSLDDEGKLLPANKAPRGAASRLADLEKWAMRLPDPNVSTSQQEAPEAQAGADVITPRDIFGIGGQLAIWQWIEQCDISPGANVARKLEAWIARYLNVESVRLSSKVRCPPTITGIEPCYDVDRSKGVQGGCSGVSPWFQKEGTTAPK